MRFKQMSAGMTQLTLVAAFIFGSFTLSIILESTYVPLQKNGGPERVISVDAEQLTPLDYTLSFEVSGSVIALNTVAIMPQISGRVTHVNPHFYAGGTFEAEEPLFTIDQKLYTLAVRQATAELNRVTAELDLEQAEIQAAIKGWRQLNGNAPVPMLVAREPQLERASAQVEVAQLQLEKALLDLERTQFSLPFEGRVISSDIAPGHYVTVGQGYGHVFDQRMLEVESSLNTEQLYWLQEASTQDIEIRIKTPHQIKSYPAHLARTISRIDTATRFASAYFAFDTQGDDILPGTFATVSVKTDPVANVVLAPADALQADGQMWRIDDANHLRAFSPRILSIEKDKVAIQGISAPIQVVTSRLAGAYEGMQVAPRSPQIAQLDQDEDANV